ncbi:hypothetical protein T492DRAFT_63937 [Pavlovales sp. CCMP2436]|nr:hypothetical protein T492DRAFT_63937 [Pavlovales sp. CCMP2436]
MEAPWVNIYPTLSWLPLTPTTIRVRFFLNLFECVLILWESALAFLSKLCSCSCYCNTALISQPLIPTTNRVRFVYLSIYMCRQQTRLIL